jgi:alpha-tubulin suppressor-like RCC1 family protein
MFGIKTLIEKLNSEINSGTLSELDTARALGAIESLENHSVSSVKTFGDLPPAESNTGRFFWIELENRYVLSNGVSWDINNIIITIIPVNLYAWGINTNGRLGDNTIADRSSPVSVVGGFTDWIQVSAGNAHSLGVRANGTAWAWGNNLNGRLGDNTIADRSSPVSVAGGFTDWIQVSAGNAHSLGVRANGSAWAWGLNTNGRLGDNTATARSSPVSVVGGFTDWIQVSAGGSHSLGLRANGTAWAWGLNSNGRLGDNSTTSRLSPVSVVGGFTDWIQVSAGDSHSLGLRANGTAWAWGLNTNGRLGDNSITSRLSPVSVVGGFTDWIQVSAGNAHSLGVRANGTAWAWGNNLNGRLGDNSTTVRSSPVSVVGGFTDWIQVSAGNAHSLGVRANGSAWAWGLNTNGQLGDNTATARSSPVSVVGGFTDWIQVSGGGSHSLGVRG